MNNYYLYNDNQLIALLREKHPIGNDAFNVIYSRYSERLKAYCSFKSENSHESKEIFQEAWMKFHHAVLSGKNDIVLPAYLYAIVRNLSIDKYRMQKNYGIVYSESIDYEQFSDTLNLQTSIENRELLTLITLALEQLSDIYRETFVLKWFSGLTYPEISKVTGETVDCVKKRSYRALNEVLAILDPIINELRK